MLRRALVFGILVSIHLWAAGLADVTRQVRNLTLDPEECYRVRDLNFSKDDIRFFLTDGYLIFAKPIQGVRLAAVFAADVEGGDAEVIVFPPHRSERMSLASFTSSPNLNDHFKTAVLVFSDDTGAELIGQIHSRPDLAKSPEAGLLVAGSWTSVARNLAASFEIRLISDLFSLRRAANGFFYAGVGGKRLGNFDLLRDPRAPEQITIGQVNALRDRVFFDVWTSFESRTFREGKRPAPDQADRLRNFRILATLEPNLHLRATTHATLQAGANPDRVLSFEISRRMRVTAARIDGQSAEILQRESLRANLIRGADNEIFLVLPPTPLQAGRDYQIEFEHEGDVISESGNRVYFVGARGSWYPNRAGQFADYEITFRYPKTLSLVATGRVVAETTENDFRVTRRKTATPVRFAGFNLGDYERATVSRGRYTVQVCANRRVESALEASPHTVVLLPPFSPRGSRTAGAVLAMPDHATRPDPTARLQTLASDVAAALEFMAGRFGPPPLPEITVAPIPGSFGQGFPGLIYLSTLSYLAPKERPAGTRTEAASLVLSEILYAHEIAHQWWGNTVTTAGYRDEWLMESLADYSALLFQEKRHGARTLESILEKYKNMLLETTPDGKTFESMGPIVWGARLQTSQAPEAWRAITYQKGAWIMHMLRRRLGDERFFALLAELCRRYRFQSVTTEQFRLLAKDYLPPRSQDPALEEFFDRWVYSTGIPTLKLTHSLQGRAPAYRLRVTITQDGLEEDAGVYVPVEIQFARGKSITRWVRTGSDPVTFNMPLRQAPSKVLLDPGLSVLAIHK
jgi:hypothetical protein